MKVTDAKLPQHRIEASIREETHGDLVEIIMTGDYRDENIYLTKENAQKFGQALLDLSQQLEV